MLILRDPVKVVGKVRSTDLHQQCKYVIVPIICPMVI